MDPATWLTRGTIWLALTLYTVGEAMLAFRDRPAAEAAGRLNAAGCAAFLTHVAAAFHFHHGWSHAAAYADTARQTAEFTGWNWGGGLYVNYLFALVWLGDVAWRRAATPARGARPGWVTWSLRAWFLFMIFNGAVVFVRGPARWYGLALCVVLAGCWWPRTKARMNPRDDAPPA